MKKTVFTLLILSVTISAMAQPTLMAITNNPVVGDVFQGHQCDSTGYSTMTPGGVTGAGVIWNFSSLVQTGLDTTHFYSSVGEPFIDSFPGSNFITYNPYNSTSGITYEYFTTDINKFALSGFCDSFSGYKFVAYYPRPKILLNYPSTYNSVFVDTTISLVLGNSYSKNINIDSVNCDAYGTLTIPTGTYTNVLRIHWTSHSTDSNTTSVNYSSSESYLWFTPGFHYPLLTLAYDTAFGSKYLSNISYFSQMAARVNEINKNEISLQAIPNPANSLLNIQFNLIDKNIATLSITDLMGENIAVIDNSHLQEGINNISYSVADLPNGMYFLNLKTPTGNVSKKIVVNR